MFYCFTCYFTISLKISVKHTNIVSESQQKQYKIIDFKQLYLAKISSLHSSGRLGIGTYHIKDAKLAMFKNSAEVYGVIECAEGNFKFSERMLVNQLTSLIIPFVNEYVKTNKVDYLKVDVVERYACLKDAKTGKRVDSTTKAFDTGNLLIVPPMSKIKNDEELIQKAIVEELVQKAIVEQQPIPDQIRDSSQSHEQPTKPLMVIQVDNSGKQSVEIVKEVGNIELEQDVDKLRQMFDEKRTAYEQATNDQEKEELNDLLTRIAKRINTLTTR
jgi:hypothetical protein